MKIQLPGAARDARGRGASAANGVKLSVVLLLASCGAKTGLFGSGEPEACSFVEAEAALAPLDVFFMLDTSGSMELATASGASKWLEVRAALEGFFVDPQSSGIGVALSFFPVEDESVPELCASPRDCGDPAGCRFLGLCMPSGAELCESHSDCAARGQPRDHCERVGLCQNGGQTPCFVATPATYCGSANCVEVGFCLNRYSCDPSDYAAPAHPLEGLPGAAAELSSLLAARARRGATPTLPALGGALSAARSWATAHPSHKVIVVLATDGLPMLCGTADYSIASIPAAVAEVASEAARGAEAGIQTFVIGVFGPAEVSDPEANLDAIARAGGSGSAFLIATVEQVRARFLVALADVRRRAKSCEFSISDAMASVDNQRIEVRLAGDGTQPVAVPRLESARACGAAGGFYFDVAAPQATPRRVILCQASCDQLGTGPGRKVELSLDCDG